MTGNNFFRTLSVKMTAASVIKQLGEPPPFCCVRTAGTGNRSWFLERRFEGLFLAPPSG